MAKPSIPQLVTAGVIAEANSVPLQRVAHILNTRPHIRPVARAANTRLYLREAISQVRYELNKIDAKRAGREMANA